ncbi:MAG: hypothetical protein NUV56_00455, partial [Candidatus Uhrbacteria bacterium]|nr:hypothetical protein [Candidatus Uhrbacteria bacterium]
LFACSTPPPGKTIDIVEGEYFGELREEDLLPDVVIKEEGTALHNVLYEEDGVLWAKATFTGKIAKGLIVLEGTEVERIEGVTVDDEQLSCVLVVAKVPLDITGFFYDDRRFLDLEVEKVGWVTMELVPPPPPDDPPEQI